MRIQYSTTKVALGFPFGESSACSAVCTGACAGRQSAGGGCHRVSNHTCAISFLQKERKLSACDRSILNPCSYLPCQLSEDGSPVNTLPCKTLSCNAGENRTSTAVAQAINLGLTLGSKYRHIILMIVSSS